MFYGRPFGWRPGYGCYTPWYYPRNYYWYPPAYYWWAPPPPFWNYDPLWGAPPIYQTQTTYVISSGGGGAPPTGYPLTDDDNLELEYYPLPQGWEMRRDGQNRRFFVDHNTRATSWQDPRVSNLYMQQQNDPRLAQYQQGLPSGWEARLDPNGNPFFIDQANKQTTWLDPRKPPEQNLLPPGWEQKQDDKGRTYFVDHFNQRTQWADPRVHATEMPNSSKPLPTGWEERHDEKGRVYYANSSTKTTQWQDPRDPSPNLQRPAAPPGATPSDTPGSPLPPSGPDAFTMGSPIPPGQQ